MSASDQANQLYMECQSRGLAEENERLKAAIERLLLPVAARIVSWACDNLARYEEGKPIPEEVRAPFTEAQVYECLGWSYYEGADGDEYPWLDPDWTRDQLREALLESCQAVE